MCYIVCTALCIYMSVVYLFCLLFWWYFCLSVNVWLVLVCCMFTHPVSLLNPFLEPTSTKQRGKVSCPEKQLESLMGFELTIDWLQVSHYSYCATTIVIFVLLITQNCVRILKSFSCACFLWHCMTATETIVHTTVVIV